MFASKAFAVLATTAFGGVALGWILPPTTPIGGPTVAELKRSPSLASVPPSFEPQPPQPVFDPGLRGLDLTDRSTSFDRPVPVDEVADYSRQQPYFDDPRRAFRKGYRLARHYDLTNPEECEQYSDQSEVEGCRSYVERAEEPDQAEPR